VPAAAAWCQCLMLEMDAMSFILGASLRNMPKCAQQATSVGQKSDNELALEVPGFNANYNV
jgi:hypothetical protein